MGWRNILIAQADHLVKYAMTVRRLVATKDVDLDEVCRNLLSAQQVSTSALGEIYDSCGPFFPNEKHPRPRDPRTIKCEECGDFFVPGATPKCPNCGTTHKE